MCKANYSAAAVFLSLQVVSEGTGPNDQLYVQATFPYLDVWLGVVMIYQAATFRQEVPVNARIQFKPDRGGQRERERKHAHA